jgi:hypothetical protein
MRRAPLLLTRKLPERYPEPILLPMADQSDKVAAEARTDAAILNGPYEDPRPVLRARLRYLREEQPAAFTAALEYYEETLLPVVAAADSDPLTEWIEYGRRLGDLTARGKTLEIDGSGRARPFRARAPATGLILHIPDDTSAEALAIAVPREPSEAQRASYALLIDRARGLEKSSDD